MLNCDPSKSIIVIFIIYSNVYPTGTNLLSVKIAQSKIKKGHVKHSLISILDFLLYYFSNFGKSLFPLIFFKIPKKGVPYVPSFQ